jgi:hypothetical protein
VDLPATTTPIRAADLLRYENGIAASAPISSAWTANTAVKAGQLLTQAGTLYSVNADMTTPSSFATTGLTAVSGGGSSSGLPLWQPSTAYTAGQFVVNPSGFIVSANSTFTSTGSYVAGNWTIVDDSRYAQSSSIAPLAQSGQTPSQAPVALAAAAAVGALAFAARADHQHAAYGALECWGDGSDGVATFDGTATPAGTTKVNSTLYRLNDDVNYSSLTGSAGITLDTNGFKLNVSGTATGPATGTAFTVSGVTLNRYGSIGAGQAGKTATTGAGAATSFPYWYLWIQTNTAAGSGGAGTSGGATGGTSLSTAGTGNAPAACRGLNRNFWNAINGLVQPFDASNQSGSTAGLSSLVGGGFGGSSGAGDGTNAGGSGGAGGNVVIANIRQVVGIINFTAPGTAGANAATGNCGGGGGGQGGVVRVNSADLTGWTGAVSAAGGAGGTGVGTGTAGTTGGAGYARATQWV